MGKWAILALLAFGLDGCVPCENCGGGYYEPGEVGEQQRDRDHDRGDRHHDGHHRDGDRGGHHGDRHHGDRDRDRDRH